jgi:hypothetical protein
MIRTLVVLIAGLAVSACGLSLPSAVDAAPFEARTDFSVLAADGRYCALDKDEAGTIVVKSEEDCDRIRWDGDARLYRPMDDAQAAPVATVDLGGGLFLTQTMPKEAGDADDPYWLGAMIVEGDAAAIIPVPNGSQIEPFVASYPGIALGPFSSWPVAEPEDTAIPPPPPPAFYHIAAGSPQDVRSLVREIAVSAMGEMIAKAKEEGVPLVEMVPILVRDESGAGGPPTAQQQRDIDAVLAKLQSLAR